MTVTLEADGKELARRAALELTRGTADVRRLYAIEGIEVRAAAADPESTLVDFYGHASVTGKPYEMYGGPDKGGWNETVDPGAFKRTLKANPDVAFLVNHTGMTLARTKAGTLKLAEDTVGLEVRAQLDTRVTAVNDLVLLMQAGNMDEMSFAFRILDQHWYDADGEEVPYWDMAGVNRHISEVSIQKGDVSAVNYGASPLTDASLRGLLPDRRMFAGALQEVRAGAVLSAATKATLQSVLDCMSEGGDCMDEGMQMLSDLMGVANPDTDEAAPETDGMMAAVQVEAQRRAFMLRHAEVL